MWWSLYISTLKMILNPTQFKILIHIFYRKYTSNWCCQVHKTCTKELLSMCKYWLFEELATRQWCQYLVIKLSDDCGGAIMTIFLLFALLLSLLASAQSWCLPNLWCAALDDLVSWIWELGQETIIYYSMAAWLHQAKVQQAAVRIEMECIYRDLFITEFHCTTP